MPDEPTLKAFGFLEKQEIPEVVELARMFFNESDMGVFADFSSENFTLVLENSIESPSLTFLVFRTRGEVRGFVSFGMDFGYTQQPLALGSLLYVSPEYRRGPAGRLLMKAAESVARENGCVAFYMGAMANIASVESTLPNMYQKLGFDALPYWGRKTLKEENP